MKKYQITLTEGMANQVISSLQIDNQALGEYIRMQVFKAKAEEQFKIATMKVQGALQKLNGVEPAPKRQGASAGMEATH